MNQVTSRGVERHRRARGLILARLIIVASLLGASSTASARIQDYQILRLLTYATDCDIDRLDAAPSAAGKRRFRAFCRNLTFYPDGIDVLCDDAENEQTCHILTSPRRFDNLRALQRGG